MSQQKKSKWQIKTNAKGLKPYEHLAQAIVIQAVNDWKEAKDKPIRRYVIEKFFRSGWFQALYGAGLSGEAFIRKLCDREAKAAGGSNGIQSRTTDQDAG